MGSKRGFQIRISRVFSGIKMKGMSVKVIGGCWRGDCREGLFFRELVAEKWSSVFRVIRELNGSGFVADNDSEVLGARDGCEGKKTVTESFNVVDICESKNGFVAVIGNEVTFSCCFVGRLFCTVISKGNGDIAGLDVVKVTENWCVMAGGATVGKPVAKV
jgi:hypothetical protein